MATALCLRHEAGDTLGVAPDALREAGLDPVVLDVWEARPWPDPADFDAFVVFGGSMSSLYDDRHPYLAREREMLRRSIDVGLPTLGVCLGAQLLAQACEAPVRPASEPEVGFKQLSVAVEGRDDPLVAPFVQGGPAFEWHEDEFELPAGATLLATGERGSVQAYRRGPAVGVQFHPEIDEHEIGSWIQVAGEAIRTKWGRDPDELRAETRREITSHMERGRRFFAGFARHATAGLDRRTA